MNNYLIEYINQVVALANAFQIIMHEDSSMIYQLASEKMERLSSFTINKASDLK